MIEEGDNQTEIEAEELSVASQWQLIRRKFLRHKLAVGALVVLAILYFIVVFAEFISPYDPTRYDSSYIYTPPQRIHFFDEKGSFHLRPFVYGIKLEQHMLTFRRAYTEDKRHRHPIYFLVHGDPYKLWGLFPSDIHLFGIKEGVMFLFGSDKMGRDMFSRIIYGERISLSIGLVGVAASFIIGVIIGSISGYYGGIVDKIIQRVIELIRSMPTIPLWMALSVCLPPYWPVIKVYFGIVVILSLVGWTSLARVVRGKFMSLKEEDFILAAKISGANETRVIFKHLLPSFYSYIIASLTLSVPAMILGETALSFIGLGLQPPAISLGVLLKEAQHISVLAHSPWLLIPGAIVIIVVLAFNFLGDGLRDAADPYATI